MSLNKCEQIITLKTRIPIKCFAVLSVKNKKKNYHNATASQHSSETEKKMNYYANSIANAKRNETKQKH